MQDHVHAAEGVPVGRLLARLALACVAVVTAGSPARSDAATEACEQLAVRRAQAAQRSDLAGLHQAATSYLERCRAAHSKTELSAAMAELAGVRRMAGQGEEALATAQDCIRFEYLALTCHIEKALALQALGMRTEARQVIGTSREVASKLRTIGYHELAKIESGRSRIKPDHLAALSREAQARLRMADTGERVLLEAERALGVK